MVLFCKEYGIESCEVLETIVSGDTESENVSIEVLACNIAIASHFVKIDLENVKLGKSSSWNR